MEEATVTITEVLSIVSPDLIAGYEQKNFNGKTFGEIRRDCEVTSRELRINSILQGVVAIILSCLAMAWLLTISFGDTAMYFKVGVPAICLLILFCFSWPLIKDASVYKERQMHCCREEWNFIRSVWKLNPTTAPIEYYTKESVLNTLAGLVLCLKNAEIQFKKQRMLENVNTEWVVSYAGQELSARGKFEDTLRCAERFGLTLTKPEKDKLFSNAEKIIAKTNES